VNREFHLEGHGFVILERDNLAVKGALIWALVTIATILGPLQHFSGVSLVKKQ
jgi:hypothetical protein